jgi:hypothetical protein
VTVLRRCVLDGLDNRLGNAPIPPQQNNLSDRAATRRIMGRTWDSLEPESEAQNRNRRDRPTCSPRGSMAGVTCTIPS